MAPLDSLPADQRAVLQLVLRRGRSYDEIADMLSIDRAGVRDRALKALDALGPQTRVPVERRALITDYLLGQLPERVRQDTRDRLAQSASERAWARVVASELEPVAASPLPEIPVDTRAAGPAAAPQEPERATAPGRPRERPRERERPAPQPRTVSEPRPQRDRPASRRGGALLLALGALVVVAVVIVLLVSGSGSSKHSSSTTQASATTSTTPTTATSTSTGTQSTPTPVAQINLKSPTGSRAAGIAIVLKQGRTVAIVIRAANVPPNTSHNAYAVWLYNSAADSHLLGFVNPGVKANGQLTTAGALPTDAARFSQLLVTLETVATPKAPGTIVLQGQLTGVH